MSEPTKRCSRCSEPIDRVVARIAIESGPLHDSHPVMDLCVDCSESLERWIARRRHGRSSRGASGGGPREHFHRHADEYGPAEPYSPETGGGVLFLGSDSARQIIVTMIVVAIFALSATLFASIMR